MRKAAPRDKPFTCKKGHVTEVGWTGKDEYRCKECLRLVRSAANRRFYYSNRERLIRYKKNQARTWGREKHNAANMRSYYAHREARLATVAAYRERMIASGRMNGKGVILCVPPTLRKKLGMIVPKEGSHED